MRRAARIDPVQVEIVRALRAAGCSVQALSPAGKEDAGLPDLLVARNRSMFLLEIKTPGQKPSERQREWHARWRAPVAVVSSVSEAMRTVGAL